MSLCFIIKPRQCSICAKHFRCPTLPPSSPVVSYFNPTPLLHMCNCFSHIAKQSFILPTKPTDSLLLHPPLPLLVLTSVFLRWCTCLTRCMQSPVMLSSDICPTAQTKTTVACVCSCTFQDHTSAPKFST